MQPQAVLLLLSRGPVKGVTGSFCSKECQRPGKQPQVEIGSQASWTQGNKRHRQRESMSRNVWGIWSEGEMFHLLTILSYPCL